MYAALNFLSFMSACLTWMCVQLTHQNTYQESLQWDFVTLCVWSPSLCLSVLRGCSWYISSKKCKADRIDMHTGPGIWYIELWLPTSDSSVAELESSCWRLNVDSAVHDCVHYGDWVSLPSSLQVLQLESGDENRGICWQLKSWETHIAALLCAISVSDMWFCWWGSQTTDAYSDTGQTRPL